MGKRVYTVLAIDGGGIRGIIPARILQEIEERTGKPIAELFDLIGGNSTGAIIAGGLNVPDDKDPTKPKFSAKELKEIYHDNGDKIFPEIKYRQLRHILPGTDGFYDPKPLEEVLEQYFGELKMGDALTNLMIPATGIKSYRPVWINSLKGQKDPDGWKTMKMRDAVRASGAAPTFLPTRYFYTRPNPKAPDATERHALVDGWSFAGNLTRRLYTTGKKLAPADAEVIVVHLGTGFNEVKFTPDEFNKMTPLGLISKANGALLVNMSFDMTSFEVNQNLKEEIGDRFFSFDRALNDDDHDPEKDGPAPAHQMDDASKENREALEAFAEKLIEDNDELLTRLCNIIKYKIYADEQHLLSQQALQELTDILAGAVDVDHLDKLYAQMVKYSSNLPHVNVPEDEKEVYKLAQQLQEEDKDDLDRIYGVLQTSKAAQEYKLVKAFKRVARKIAHPKKYWDHRQEEKKKKQANDNKNPENKKPKKKWFGRGGP